MDEMQELKREIEQLKKRNEIVGANKAWETSRTRKILIMIITYVISAFFFIAMENPQPWLSAVVPTLGFFLSTATLSIFKNLWIRYRYKKESLM